MKSSLEQIQAATADMTSMWENIQKGSNMDNVEVNVIKQSLLMMQGWENVQSSMIQAYRDLISKAVESSVKCYASHLMPSPLDFFQGSSKSDITDENIEGEKGPKSSGTQIVESSEDEEGEQNQ